MSDDWVRAAGLPPTFIGILCEGARADKNFIRQLGFCQFISKKPIFHPQIVGEIMNIDIGMFWTIYHAVCCKCVIQVWDCPWTWPDNQGSHVKWQGWKYIELHYSINGTCIIRPFGREGSMVLFLKYKIWQGTDWGQANICYQVRQVRILSLECVTV